MSRVTGKFQITLPKRLVEAYDIKVGDELELVAAGDTISIVPASAVKPAAARDERLRIFDQASRRERARQREHEYAPARSRGWTREALYNRGRAR